ncbi:MAG: GTPase [Candidatus Micrarchaeia archaeon]
MPSNKAAEIESKLAELEEEKHKITKNKATEKGLKHLVRRIIKIKAELEEAKKKKEGSGFFIKKSGDRTVAFLGFPNAGKSSLINALADTNSKVAPYQFTTLSIVPGTLTYNNVHIQILDLPGIIENAHSGVGEGKNVLTAVRNSDLIIFVLDINDVEKIDVLIKELNLFDIYINKNLPDIKIEKSFSGGIKILYNNSSMKDEEIKLILKNFGIYNATVSINSDISPEEFLGLISKRSRYIKAIIALNKIDTKENYNEIAKALSEKYKMEVVPISATMLYNLDSLKETIYKNLDAIVIYLKARLDNDPPMPMVLKKGDSVQDAIIKLHTDLADKIKYAYVTGPSTKFPNQRVGLDHVLMDGDVVTFIRKLG